VIHAASRQAIAALRQQTEPILDQAGSVEGLTGLAAELYSVADFLGGTPRLRRALSDPASLQHARSSLAGALFDEKISSSAAQIVQRAVSLRWSSQWDMLDAIEATGDDALFAAAERQGILDDVEDELFRFERIIDGEGELAGLLDDRSVATERRVALLDSVLADKVQLVTHDLLAHAVSSDRRRALPFALEDLLKSAAARRERSIARVISAVMLTDAQEQRLAAALSQMYGRAISVRTAVDPAVLGGLIVRVGDEVIDGSVATRLSRARDAVAG
jgi:F-type H+-transporting ATPase subunit delta